MANATATSQNSTKRISQGRRSLEIQLKDSAANARCSSTYNRELTGSHRVLNDTIVDFHRTVLEWRSKDFSGIEAIRKLAASTRGTKQYDESCGVIRKKLEDMKLLAQKLSTYAFRLEHLAVLQGQQAEKPYALSWTFTEFAVCARQISEIYMADTDMKYSLIVRMLTRIPDFALVSAIWNTTTVDQISPQLEAMLCEAKLK